MRLPRFIASGGVRETGLVRAQDIGALTNVGGAEFRAIERAGRAIGHVSDLAFKAGMKRKALDDDIRWGNATTKMEEGHRTSFNALRDADYSVDDPLPGDPNYNKAPLQLSLEKKATLTKDTLAERDKQAEEVELSFPTKEGKEKFRLWYNERRLDYDEDYTKINNAKHNAYQEERLTTLARNAYLAGDITAGDSYIDSMDKNELITPLKATALKADGIELSVKSQATELSRLGLYHEARELITSSSLEVLDKESFGNMIDTAEKRAKAKAKVVDEKAIEAERQAVDDIFILPREEFLAESMDVLDMINNSTILPVKDKELQRAKINKRIDAISSGKIDPVDEFDPKTYDALSIRIARNSKAVNGTDISGRVGLGKNGGITTKQSEELTRLKKFYDGADVLGNSLHRTYTSAITGLKTAKRFSRNKTENIQFAAQARSVLDSWAVQNPDATEDDYQAFFDRLIDNSRMNTWGRGWFTRKAEEDRISIRENIEDIQKELAGETRKYGKGDTRIIGGVTYTFNGKTWND